MSATKELTELQTEILEFAENRGEIPQSIISPSVTLIGFSASPAQLEAIHSKLDWKLMMLCTSDIKSEYHFTMSFYDARGRCFNKDFEWGNTFNPMVSWRVGEVYSREFSWQPHLLTLRGAMRTMAPGKVRVLLEAKALKQKLQPMPEVIANAWEVK